MTPTANKLYQLVRKGSMSAPAEALTKFWADLREKSRTRVEHPDFPDALKEVAGELVATLWTTAQTAARESLTAYRAEAEEMVAKAKATVVAAEADRDAQRLSVNGSKFHTKLPSSIVQSLESVEVNIPRRKSPPSGCSAALLVYLLP
ncbi:DNA-binding protein [Candidimonas sp. SYP-B2681]|uniref:DNA-binding protein n=1 Tax=Candidimonas sp. SYP-B2681 TaxID=2497686 RepID=UPI001F392760|nr:DNA-binding protein [Candidimonas sp. SYP-B2681]